MNLRDKLSHLALFSLFIAACVLSVHLIPKDQGCMAAKTEKPADGSPALCESEFLKTHVF